MSGVASQELKGQGTNMMEDIRFRLATLEDNQKDALEHRINHTIELTQLRADISGVKESVEKLVVAFEKNNEKIEGRRAWFFKTVATVVIGAVVAFALAGGFVV